MKRTRALSAAMGLGSLALVGALLAPDLTSAGYTDSTFARSSLSTAAIPERSHSASDLSSASALELSEAGELYVTGYRGTGDGNGNVNTAPTADPTRVKFPSGVRIVDAGGSTNDFSEATFPGTTSFMALDSDGGVWTWGAPYGGRNLLGRGSLSVGDSARAGRVTQTTTGEALPPIVSMARIENQFLALDATGTLWAWGYGGENLPYSKGAISQPLPFPVRESGERMGNSDCHTASGSRANAGEVAWRSIWGGSNGAAGVGRDGLVYSWGFDSSAGTPGSTYVHTRCPALNEGANRALFQRYPDVYRTANGAVYDESSLSTEEARTQRYLEIVSDMRGSVIPSCDGSLGVSQIDDSGCPVRQFGVDARHYRMLTSQGELLTWMTGARNGYGTKFLGRTPSETTPEEVPAPVAGDLKIDRVAAGVSSMVALGADGVVYGWGDNNACQAVGAPTINGAVTGGTCASVSNVGAANTRYWVQQPMPVADIPAGVRVTAISSAACSTWASTADGAEYAWGGGLVSGYLFNRCSVPGGAAAGYKIYEANKATIDQPFGSPIADAATGTVRVK